MYRQVGVRPQAAKPWTHILRTSGKCSSRGSLDETCISERVPGQGQLEDRAATGENCPGIRESPPRAQRHSQSVAPLPQGLVHPETGNLGPLRSTSKIRGGRTGRETILLFHKH